MAMIKDEMDDIEMSSADYTDDNKGIFVFNSLKNF